MRNGRIMDLLTRNLKIFKDGRLHSEIRKLDLIFRSYPGSRKLGKLSEVCQLFVVSSSQWGVVGFRIAQVSG